MANQQNKLEKLDDLDKLERAVRILLDNQKNQSESLSSAALLARKLNVQLQGLFIEEENLIRAANLPLSREISLWSAKERQLSGESIHRTLRAYARCQQKVLEKVATEGEINYSFQTIRGEKVNWIIENVKTTGILFIGGHDLIPKPYQSLKYCSEVTPPLIALFNGSIASKHALEIAIQIARKSNRTLLILLLFDDSSTEESSKVQLDSLLISYPDIDVDIEITSNNHVFSALHKHRIYMLISPSDIEWVQDKKSLGKLIQQIHCPIVLVS